MTPRLVARPPAVLRCAVCHGDLAPRRWTCPGCRTALHVDCVQQLGQCPTIGCARTPSVPCCTSRSRPTAAAQPAAATTSLEAAVFWVPAILELLWPVWVYTGVLLRNALGLRHPTFMGPALNGVPAMLAVALGAGPAVGHLLLAPAAAGCGIGGRYHRRAALGAATGLLFSLLTLYVVAWCVRD